MVSTELIYIISHSLSFQPLYFTRHLLEASLMYCLRGHSPPFVGGREDAFHESMPSPGVADSKNCMEMRLRGARFLSWFRHCPAT